MSTLTIRFGRPVLLRDAGDFCSFFNINKWILIDRTIHITTKDKENSHILHALIKWYMETRTTTGNQELDWIIWSITKCHVQ